MALVCRRAGWASGLLVLLATGLASAQSEVPEPPPPTEPWYEQIQLRAFVDAYYQQNLAFPKPQTYKPPTRYFDGQQGFGLAWVGFDAAFAPEPVGATVSLRFGPLAKLHAVGANEPNAENTDLDNGLEWVKQAYVSWKPDGADGVFTLDFGKFDTFVGAEVDDSQDNFNYTRGLIFTYAQPRWHAGLRATAELLPELSLTAMAVNGSDRTFDNNVGKTFGLQAVINPSESFAASIGWIGGPEQSDSTSVACSAGTAYDPGTGGCSPSTDAEARTYVVDRGGANEFDAWRHLFDVVLTLQPTETLAFVANGVYGMEGVRPEDEFAEDTDTDIQRWYGGALLARMQLSHVWAVAARGEYLADKDGRALRLMLPGDEHVHDAKLASATLTIEARASENLILRWENRGDFVLDADPTKKIFQEDVRDGSQRLFTSTLGVVVTTE